LWSQAESRPVAEWPPEALVCGCLRVSRGALCDAIARGSASADALSALMGAGTLCGACRPLLAELVATAPERDRETQLPAEIHALAPPQDPAPEGAPSDGPETVRSPRHEPVIADVTA